MTDREAAAFRRRVLGWYRLHGRHDLPWRMTRNPWRILVSEMMLQQTQVERVRGFYPPFVRRFPSPARMGAAPVRAVVAAWQGLGKIQNPATQKIERDLNNAKVSIDMLEMIKDKMKGNLTAEEEKRLAAYVAAHLSRVDEKTWQLTRQAPPRWALLSWRPN